MLKKTITFDKNIQKEFAQLSGDFNPIHIDEHFARKTTYSQCLVHGVHMLMRGLDIFAENLNKKFFVEKINTKFNGAVSVGSKLRYEVEILENKSKITAYLKNDKVAMKTQINFCLEEEKSSNLQNKKQKKEDCIYVPIEKMPEAKGSEKLTLDKNLNAKLFKNLDLYCPDVISSILLASTKIIGMKVPGLNSLFTGIKLNFDKEVYKAKEMAYSTDYFNETLRIANISLKTEGVEGKLDAFYRYEAIEQESYSEICKKVKKDEFLNQTAFIVGGSRGLGSLCAKILSAGGAKVFFTYCKCEDEALKIQEDINSQGGNSKALCLDVNKILKSFSKKLEKEENLTIYYFATPRIASNDEFNFEDFCKFNNYYIKGFTEIIKNLKNAKGFFCPSTIFIDEVNPKMIEYSMSKYAMELYCKHLEQNKNIKVLTPRLPRMLTDQTAAVGVFEYGSSFDVLYEKIKEFNGLLNG